MPQLTMSALFVILLAQTPFVSAQDHSGLMDKTRLPVEAKGVDDFVPRGWVMEEQVPGDLNGDSIPDIALKLVQKDEGNRKLVILFVGKNGILRKAASADKLLLCTTCGGAFYGVAEASADVKIQKGVLIVSQEFGSNDLTDQTFRFRYKPKIEKFILIGLDIAETNRGAGATVKKSTNFLTGFKLVTRSQFDEHLDKEIIKSTSRKMIDKKQITIEQINYEDY